MDVTDSITSLLPDELITEDMVYRASDPALARYIRGSAGFIADPDSARWVKLIPNGMATIFIDLECQTPGTIIGLCDKPLYLDLYAQGRTMIILLTPLGTYTALGVPMHRLANVSASLASTPFPSHRLMRKLSQAPDWASRFATLEEFFEQRLAEGTKPAQAVDQAWTRMTELSGNIAIEALVQEIGWSRRYLASLFVEQVGLSPKTVARVLRFRRALRLLCESSGRHVSEIARVCGYTDQSHLNHDFQILARRTPTDFRRRWLRAEVTP